ncbi:uncharacterized protein SCHCODRAFT_01053121, partial [Schizophyllum commune H4-8]|uniref:uncharacterized protein n=1 Tax=Schizophyllum commune (strain H4-8 / FGSC 9210) TaxID=578458 RepID=UPI0021601D98
SINLCSSCRRDTVFSIHIPSNVDHTPSPMEKRAMQTYMQETQQSLVELDVQKQAVQRVMDSIITVETKLRHALDMQRAYVAPIRRVPGEILEIIFELSCMEAALGLDRCTPLDISAVCKQWREIMNGCPRIWSSMQFTNIPFIDWSQRGPAAKRLKYCLSMTKGLPLIQPVRANRNTGCSGLNLLKILARHTDQWLHFQADDLWEEPVTLLQGRSYSRLHTLNIDASILELMTAGSSRPFWNTPALRTLIIKNALGGQNIFPALTTLPLGQLHELHTTVPPDWALVLLTGCPNLVRWVHDFRPYMIHSRYGMPREVRLSHLHVIHADHFHAGDCAYLNCIVAPSLRTLYLTWSHPRFGAPRWAAPIPLAFLQRAESTVQELTLRDPPAGIRANIPLFSKLRLLSLHTQSSDQLLDDFFVSLTERTAGSELATLPMLEELELGGHGRYRGQKVLEMVEARLAAGRPLRSLDLDLFSVDMEYFGSLEVLERLRDLVPEFVGSD